MYKDDTKKYLLNAELSTPKGFISKDSDDDIIKASKKLNYPLVLKPIDASGGKGVIANIKNEPDLREAISYVRKIKNIGGTIINIEYTNPIKI